MLKYCSVGSGSSGNCHYIGYKNTNILVDAGLSGKRITTGLKDIGVDADKLKGIFITHEHIDHIKGAGILSRKFDIPVFANIKTWCSIKDKLGDIKDKNMKVFENDKTYSLGDVVVRPFSIEHDAADPVGYNFYTENDEKMSIATDIGCITENIKKHLYKSKLVVLESNYFCVELIDKGTESILLAHLSKENNFPELAYETSKGVLASNDIVVGQDVKLDVLSRNDVSNVYKMK